MDHSDALRLKATEKYILNELDPEQLDQFEEHMFDCPECAVDVRAAAMFVEQSKAVLSEARGPVPVTVVSATRSSWLDWLRPAFAAPALALLLIVVGYQNLVTYPKLHQAVSTPQSVPWAAVNVGTYGAGDVGGEIPVSPERGFLLLVRIPPEAAFTQYSAEFFNPTGQREFSLGIPVPSDREKQDRWAIQIPGAKWVPGTYILKIKGTTSTGEVQDIGQTSVELRIQ
jgi:hypothetical protein